MFRFWTDLRLFNLSKVELEEVFVEVIQHAK